MITNRKLTSTEYVKYVKRKIRIETHIELSTFSKLFNNTYKSRIKTMSLGELDP